MRVCTCDFRFPVRSRNAYQRLLLLEKEKIVCLPRGELCVIFVREIECIFVASTRCDARGELLEERNKTTPRYYHKRYKKKLYLLCDTITFSKTGYHQC